MPCTRRRRHRTAHGTFVPPTLIEIDAVADLPGEVFGPVLHVLRYRREDMEAVVRAVNATGFGLTFGVHSRIDETIERATAASAAGNQYVNRNMIGAVVGVQPFGGHGLSGTGPKAGGPLYVLRLLSQRPPMSVAEGELPGPVGERNTYGERPKGTILCIARDAAERAGPAGGGEGDGQSRDRRSGGTAPRRRAVRRQPGRSPRAQPAPGRARRARSCPSTSPPIPSSSWAPRSRSASTPPPPAATPA